MHQGLRSEQKPYTFPREQTHNGAQGFLHGLLQNSDDWQHFAQFFKLREHPQHIKIRRSGEGAKETQ